VLEGQERIFASRKEGLDGQLRILDQRIEQLGAEIRGYKAQAASASEQISLINDEIASVTVLLEKGLERKPRLLALQRQKSSIEGTRGEQLGLIAKAEQAIGETKLQAADLLNRRQNEIALELRETQDKLVELGDKLHLAADIDRRTALTAPVAGRIVDMHVHTTGGVLRPGEAVLDIVPEADELIVEARVHPNDIDSVKVGAAAQVSLTAFKMRTTPRLDGVVIKVSADALVAEDRSSYYATEIQIDPGELEKLSGVALTPGMPAETMIRTGERTFLRYIGQPILDSFHRAFREE
jgi:HlyD family type I secretion membrane fusion protein